MAPLDLHDKKDDPKTKPKGARKTALNQDQRIRQQISRTSIHESDSSSHRESCEVPHLPIQQSLPNSSLAQYEQKIERWFPKLNNVWLNSLNKENRKKLKQPIQMVKYAKKYFDSYEDINIDDEKELLPEFNEIIAQCKKDMTSED